ncbi:tetrapyrrole methylase family protein / MazG family protein [Candidatus Magnetomoraceae bacterium gMMP-15]
MNQNITAFDALKDLIKTLRGKNGCPWDRKQSPQSVEIYLIEEVYELIDAIESGRPEHVLEELGDVLFQIFFLGRLYEEMGHFNINDVAQANHEKMVRRHPHVFGDVKADTAEEVRRKWHKIKLTEKNHKASKGFLDSVPCKLPALMRASQLTERASRVGFDWPDIKGVLKKLEEELNEFKSAVDEKNPDHISSELGDVLFTLVNLARFVKVHPETALTNSINKFIKRFKYIETSLEKQGKNLESASLQEMDALWDMAKKLK